MTKLEPEQVAELQRLSNPKLNEDDLFALLAESAGLGADDDLPPPAVPIIRQKSWLKVT